MLNLLLRQSRKVDKFMQSVTIVILTVSISIPIFFCTPIIQMIFPKEFNWFSFLLMEGLLIILAIFGIVWFILSLFDTFGDEKEVFFLQDINDVINEIIEQKAQ